MKFKKLRIGIVGLGEQTIDNLMPSLCLSQYSKQISICDIDEIKLLHAGERFGVDKRYVDFREMIDVGDIDVVIVSSFPDVHYEVSKYAIQKGINVFVEKPPVTNISQLKELMYLARFKNIKTGVGMNFSYTDTNKLIKEIIVNDDFGDISFISIEHVSSKPVTPLWNLESICQSFLLAQLIHPLDYILSFGGKCKNITVFCSKECTPFFIQVMIEFENGVIGCLKSGSFFPRFKHEIEIISKEGNTIKVKDLAQIELTRKEMPAPYNVPHKNCSTVYTPSPLKSGYTKAGYAGELDAYFRSILFNSDYYHSFSDMLPVYQVLEVIMEGIERKIGSYAMDVVAEMAEK